MGHANDRTVELWQSFMPFRKDIQNSLGEDLFSMQIFNGSDTEFEKWAAIEVSDFNGIPDSMQPYTLQGGLYAVFDHIGPASAFEKTFQFIFNEWLPDSEYELDKREHFEILGSKYKNNELDSEEEIWIPIRRKE